jgi:hypothetical protein
MAMAPNSDEIASYVEGTADPATERRVTAAALMDKAVRERIALLRAALALPEDPAPPPERLHRLRDRILAEVQTVADEVNVEQRLAALPARGGGLWRVAGETWDLLLRTLAESARSLRTGEQALSLPCLAPAAASSVALEVQRETVATPEGVHIEFQQLPGEMTRLRLIVDASEFLAKSPEPASNVAFVRLEEEEASPNRHILVVTLNQAGRGFTDFVLGTSQDPVGAPDDPFVLPAPRVGLRLAGATLARLPAAPEAI